MNYTETQQKLILREMERDIPAIVAIDLRGDEYEVIYSDGAYKNYKNRYRRKDFFASWEKYGIPQVYEPDRARLLAEISLENLTEKLSSGGDFYTIAHLYVKGGPAFCRIKASKDVLDVGNIVISIRNVDAELRHDMERTAQMEELHRRETVYREAILANSAGFMEINLSRDEITTRIFDEEWFSRALSYPGSSFDGLSGRISYGVFVGGVSLRYAQHRRAR